jgi:dTDP-glucose 4,6-dehydratase/UDP-glucose 4-epimerase
LLEGKPIQVFGDGKQLRDFNYVDDCVNALLLAGANDIANGKVYNLGSKEVVALKTLAELLTNLDYGGSFELIPFPTERKAIDIGDYYSDFSLISDDLGWMPKIALEEGLRRTVNFYSKNSSEYWEDSL